MTSPSAPVLTASDPRLSRLYASAVATIQRNARDDGRGGRFLCAGGGYPTPWTRDAAINAYSAASILDPALAESTLRAVTEPTPEGDVVQQDDQRWDQIIWVTAARRHVEATADLAFAAWASGVADRTLALREEAFDAASGLFRGGALMQDGISGYPFPAADRASDSSFIGHYPQSERIRCLSTNVLHAAAYDAAAWLHGVTGSAPSPGVDAARGRDIRASVRAALHDEATGRWGYLVDDEGAVDPSQELLGLALLLELGGVTDAEAAAIADGVVRAAHGIPLVSPSFPRFAADRPGRHNMMLWPMATGQWATAAARRGAIRAFGESLEDLVRLVTASDDAFFEVYDARDGRVDGGWQVGETWPSEPDQTWSATAYVRCVHEGLLGLRPELDGLGLAPTLPAGVGSVHVEGLPWRGAALDIEVAGEGSRVVEASVDGAPWDVAARPVRLEPTGLDRTVRLVVSAG